MVCIALLRFIWHSYNHSVRTYTKKDFKHCHKSNRIWIFCDPYLLGCLWPLSSLLPLLWLSVPFAKVGGFSSLIRDILPIWYTDRYCLGIHTCHITNEIKMKMSQGPKCFGHGEVWVGKIIVIHMLCHFSMGNTVSTHPNPQRLSASIELWSLCFRLVLPRMKNSQGFCMLLSYRI